MREDKQHITYSAADILKYHEGKLTPAEMHAMEKAALEDPFLADALEGYAAAGVEVPADINELQQRVAERIEDKKVIPLVPATTKFRWWKVAAMIVAVGGAGMLVYQLGFTSKEKNIAKVSPEISQRKDTIKAAPAPSASVPARDTKAVIPGKQQAIEKFNPPAPDAAVKSPAPQAAEQPAPVTEILAGRQPGISLTDTANFQNGDLALRFRSEQAMEEESKSRLKKEEVSGNALAASKIRRAQSYVPNNIFRGKVTDLQNNALPFANITNTQDHIGTYTDAQGNFVLTSPDSVMNVQVRSLGFENNNIQLRNNLSTNKVVLKDDRSLTEVVISNKKINSRLRDGNMVLEEPEPADGWSNYDTYLANNLNIPETYKGKQSASGGEVELSFEVNQMGEPVNIKVEKSLCEVCDKEAIRLLKEGPKWKRKAKTGRRTSVTIPF